MRVGIDPLRPRPARARPPGIVLAALASLVLTISVPSNPARGAEFGADPWIKGFTDIYAGILPTAPGLYFRTDAYHYEASVERTIFNGFVQLGVDQELTRFLVMLPSRLRISPES
jgi:hypothetical protein